MHWTYVIACRTPNHFYVGQTNDPHRRIAEHRGHQIMFKGSAFVATHGFGSLVHIEEAGSARYSKLREKELTLALASEGATVHSNYADVTRDGRTVLNT